ncbi:MAG: phage tail tape measure protein, partial [Thaumarchaeota archaeon]
MRHTINIRVSGLGGVMSALSRAAGFRAPRLPMIRVPRIPSTLSRISELRSIFSELRDFQKTVVESFRAKIPEIETPPRLGRTWRGYERGIESLLGKAFRLMPPGALEGAFPRLLERAMPRLEGFIRAFQAFPRAIERLKAQLERADPREVPRLVENFTRRWERLLHNWTVFARYSGELRSLQVEISKWGAAGRGLAILLGEKIQEMSKAVGQYIKQGLESVKPAADAARGILKAAREELRANLAKSILLVMQVFGEIPREYAKRFMEYYARARGRPAARVSWREVVSFAFAPPPGAPPEVSALYTQLQKQITAAAPIGAWNRFRRVVARVWERFVSLRESISRVGSEVHRLASSARQMGQTFMNAIAGPVSFLHQMHMALRRVLFSVLLFWYSADRFIRPAAEVIRMVQAAVVAASGSMEGWSKGLRHIAALSTRFALPMKEIAGAYYEITKAGFSATEAQKILSATVRYATIFNRELNEAAKEVITILYAWGFPAEQATRVTEQLFLAVSKSKLSIADLNTILGYTAASAALYNIRLDTLLATTMALANVGVQASRIGTGLRRVIQGLVQATNLYVRGQMSAQEATEVLAESGVNWERLAEALDDVSGRSDFLRVAIEELSKVMEGGITLEERYAMKVLFGLRGVNIAIALAQHRRDILEQNLAILQQHINLEEKALQVSSRFAGIFEILNNYWLIFRTGVLEGLGQFPQLIMQHSQEITDTLLGIGRQFGQIFQKYLLQPLFGGAGGISVEGIKNAAKKVFDFLTGFLQAFLTQLRLMFQEVAGFFGQTKTDAAGLGRFIGALLGG